jgi:hypothetical protein
LLADRRATQLSGLTAVFAFAAYFSVLQRRWPLATSRESGIVGASWLGLSVVFEFGFGRLVARDSWEELLRAYDLREGNLWPLVLAWLAIGPEVARRLQPQASPRGG